MAGLTALFAVIGNALGGQTGMFIALGLAVAMNFFSYWFSDKSVLKMYGANEVTEREAPELYGVSPFSRGGAIFSLFSTHPPVEKRIERLESLRLY